MLRHASPAGQHPEPEFEEEVEEAEFEDGDEPYSEDEAAVAGVPVGRFGGAAVEAVGEGRVIFQSRSARRRRDRLKPVKAGRWTDEEHRVFQHGLKVHGRNWVAIAQMLPSRNSIQVRTHAQKFFLSQERSVRRHAGGRFKRSASELDDGSILNPATAAADGLATDALSASSVETSSFGLGVDPFAWHAKRARDGPEPFWPGALPPPPPPPASSSLPTHLGWSGFATAPNPHHAHYAHHQHLLHPAHRVGLTAATGAAGAASDLSYLGRSGAFAAPPASAPFGAAPSAENDPSFRGYLGGASGGGGSGYGAPAGFSTGAPVSGPATTTAAVASAALEAHATYHFATATAATTAPSGAFFSTAGGVGGLGGPGGPGGLGGPAGGGGAYPHSAHAVAPYQHGSSPFHPSVYGAYWTHDAAYAPVSSAPFSVPAMATTTTTSAAPSTGVLPPPYFPSSMSMYGTHPSVMHGYAPSHGFHAPPPPPTFAHAHHGAYTAAATAALEGSTATAMLGLGLGYATPHAAPTTTTVTTTSRVRGGGLVPTPAPLSAGFPTALATLAGLASVSEPEWTGPAKFATMAFAGHLDTSAGLFAGAPASPATPAGSTGSTFDGSSPASVHP